MKETMALLRSVGLQPTPQRIAVARCVLAATSHPTAEEVLDQARRKCPTLSRATVYNTLARLSERGLVRPLPIREGVVVYDPHVPKHHHFVDGETGEIHDVPWEALQVSGTEGLPGLDVREYQVVLRGRRMP